MEKMQFAEELVREFLVFRGFTNTLQCFEQELRTGIGKDFQVDKILNLIFSIYIPEFEAEKLIELLSFFKKCFSYSDSSLIATIAKLDESILRYYIVNALKCSRKDKVLDLFGLIGNDLLARDGNWSLWFAIPYLQNPQFDPQFRLYFSEEWFRALHLSIRNFLSEIFNGTRIPALLKISSERDTVNLLKKEIKQQELKLSVLQNLLDEKNEISRPIRNGAEESSNSHESHKRSTSDMKERESFQVGDNTQLRESHIPQSNLYKHPDASKSCESLPVARDDSVSGSAYDMEHEEEFPEVNVVFQDTFMGHTSPISCCRFSASGDNIASASVDGTVRIWTYESTASTNRNATIYCGTEITSLEWDCKSDRLLLIGTSDGVIKVWNTDTKRVVCDLSVSKGYPSILDLKSSPVETIFVSTAASRREGTNYVDSLGFASVSMWNMRNMSMTVLPLGKDPPAITSLSFNHNGKLLAAAATDGMIHMFDMSAGQEVTGWPAHESAISSILFGPDETSIFSFGTDGNIFEWSLHNQGKILWSRNCSRYCNPENSWQNKHEMALDNNGRRLLVTSSTVRAPIYQVRGSLGGMRALSHHGSITSVDWHPTLPIFLTGSADHSVRVTTLS